MKSSHVANLAFLLVAGLLPSSAKGAFINGAWDQWGDTDPSCIGLNGSIVTLATASNPETDPDRTWNWLTGWPKSNIYISPFATGTGGVVVGNSQESPPKPEDGWELYSSRLSVTQANKLPSFILYNRFQSVFRVFVYIGNIQSELKAQSWSLVIWLTSGRNSPGYAPRTTGALQLVDDELFKTETPTPPQTYSFDLNIPTTTSPSWIVQNIPVAYDPSSIEYPVQISFSIDRVIQGNLVASGTYCGLISSDFNLAQNGQTCPTRSIEPATPYKDRSWQAKLSDGIGSAVSFSNTVATYGDGIMTTLKYASSTGELINKSALTKGSDYSNFQAKMEYMLDRSVPGATGISSFQSKVAHVGDLITSKSDNAQLRLAPFLSFAGILTSSLPVVQSMYGFLWSPYTPPAPPTILYTTGAINLSGTLTFNGNPRFTETYGLSGAGYGPRLLDIPYYSKKASSVVDVNRRNTPVGLYRIKRRPKVYVFYPKGSIERDYYTEEERSFWIVIEPRSEWLEMNPYIEQQSGFYIDAAVVNDPNFEDPLAGGRPGTIIPVKRTNVIDQGYDVWIEEQRYRHSIWDLAPEPSIQIKFIFPNQSWVKQGPFASRSSSSKFLPTNHSMTISCETVYIEGPLNYESVKSKLPFSIPPQSPQKLLTGFLPL